MNHDAAEKTEQEKRHIRAHVDSKQVNAFRFYGISIAEMDRQELLGVICFLINHPHAFVRDVVRKVTTTEQDDAEGRPEF